VLYLDQAELATENDYKNDLVHWAKLFRATTWEDIKTLVNGNPVLEEVANRMYSENTIPEERTLMEAHERFLAQKRGAYNAGVKEGMKRSAEIIEEKNALIVEKDQRIAELEAKLKELTQNNS